MSLPEPSELEPVFAEPWQAQAFALVLQLHTRRVFTWEQWTRALAAEIAKHDAPDGSRYYECWLAALERLLQDLRLVDRDALRARTEAWAEAYRRTPRGAPVIAPGD